jgi:hypothetical protein
MLSRLSAQNTKIYTSQPYTDNTWTTVSIKRYIPTQEEAPRQAKLVKESDHWFNPTPTHSRNSALLEDESDDQQQTTFPGKTSKPLPIYISDFTTIPPLIQLLEQVVKLQYEIKILAGNQVKIQPKTSESYINERHSTHTNLNKNEITE